MSRLYGSISGSAKTQATRRGSTHLESHTRGWNAGVRVEASIIDGRDCFEIYVTGGSNNPSNQTYIGYVQDTASPLGAVFVPVSVVHDEGENVTPQSLKV